MSKPDAERYEFRMGLPAFEQEREFSLTVAPDWQPFVVLESVRQGGPRFICVRAEAISAGYSVELGADDAAAIGVEEGEYEAGASGVMAFAIVHEVEGKGLAANLAAPVVLNPSTRRGVQSIQRRGGLPAQALIAGPAEQHACS